MLPDFVSIPTLCQGLRNGESGLGTRDLRPVPMGSLWHRSSGWSQWDYLATQLQLCSCGYNFPKFCHVKTISRVSFGQVFMLESLAQELINFVGDLGLAMIYDVVQFWYQRNHRDPQTWRLVGFDHPFLQLQVLRHCHKLASCSIQTSIPSMSVVTLRLVEAFGANGHQRQRSIGSERTDLHRRLGRDWP